MIRSLRPVSLAAFPGAYPAAQPTVAVDVAVDSGGSGDLVDSEVGELHRGAPTIPSADCSYTEYLAAPHRILGAIRLPISKGRCSISEGGGIAHRIVGPKGAAGAGIA